MDVVRFKGGLGNQMFQYCLMKALQSRGRKVCVDLGFYESHMDVMPFCLLDVFKKCKIEEAPNGYFSDSINRWKDIKEDKDKCIEFTNDVQHRFFWGEDRFEEFKFIPSIFETQECKFVGYWQNEGYFKDIVNTILQDFTFSPDNKLEGYGDSIKNLTSVHVRTGTIQNILKYTIRARLNTIKELLREYQSLQMWMGLSFFLMILSG